MSVLIKGLEMPTSCESCPFSDDESRFCRVANEYIPMMLGHPEFCPLEEPQTVLYLCDRRNPECISCSPPCNATTNIEHAIGFVRARLGPEYVDERVFMKEYERPWDDQYIIKETMP